MMVGLLYLMFVRPTGRLTRLGVPLAPSWVWLRFDIRQVTDVSLCKLQHHFLCNKRRDAPVVARGPRAAAAQWLAAWPGPDPTSPSRNLDECDDAGGCNRQPRG